MILIPAPCERLPAFRYAMAVLLAVLCMQACRKPESSADSAHPNVLFIAVDDLRPELGAYGNPHIRTPHIDRLAESGVTFLQAHVQQAVCNPSRASVMTGLRPDSLRVWDLQTDFRETVPNVVTLPQHFMRNGYHSVAIGKIYHNVIPDSLSWSEPKLHVRGYPFDPDAVYRHPTYDPVRSAIRLDLDDQPLALVPMPNSRFPIMSTATGWGYWTDDGRVNQARFGSP